MEIIRESQGKRGSDSKAILEFVLISNGGL